MLMSIEQEELGNTVLLVSYHKIIKINRIDLAVFVDNSIHRRTNKVPNLGTKVPKWSQKSNVTVLH